MIDDYIRIVQAKRPLVFVIENVPQFLTKEQGKYLEKVITGLSEYEISYQVVCDWELGGYTMRKRMILVGSRIGKITIPDVNLTTKHTAGDALRKVTPDWYGFEEYSKAKPETIEKMKQVRPGHNSKDIREMARSSQRYLLSFVHGKTGDHSGQLEESKYHATGWEPDPIHCGSS